MDITATGRPYSDPALPTTKHERVLGLPTLSYKKNENKSDIKTAMGTLEKRSNHTWGKCLHRHILQRNSGKRKSGGVV